MASPREQAEACTGQSRESEERTSGRSACCAASPSSLPALLPTQPGSPREPCQSAGPVTGLASKRAPSDPRRQLHKPREPANSAPRCISGAPQVLRSPGASSQDSLTQGLARPSQHPGHEAPGPGRLCGLGEEGGATPHTYSPHCLKSQQALASPASTGRQSESVSVGCLPCGGTCGSNCWAALAAWETVSYTHSELQKMPIMSWGGWGRVLGNGGEGRGGEQRGGEGPPSGKPRAPHQSPRKDPPPVLPIGKGKPSPAQP